MKQIILGALIFLMPSCIDTKEDSRNVRWDADKAQTWNQNQDWIVGCNFIPSNAINQLEMWQDDTFDPELINKELAWAHELGFNAMRVYLHSMVWKDNPEAFKKNIDTYLEIADKNNIQTCFVLFDDCWNPDAELGIQPHPKSGIHNSGWLRDPLDKFRADTLQLYPDMQAYVTDILTTFKDDDRILIWDLYNEPGNNGYGETSLPLVKKVFEWGRLVNPSQPLTVGVWNLDFKEMNQYQINNSDIISYHNYSDSNNHQQWIDSLKQTGYPLLCTEYMARTLNSTFQTIMPLLKNKKIGAFNWGFVSGKTNTIFAWSDPRPDGNEPELWFHDIYRPDKTPFNEEEIVFIKNITN